jgi:hypothetical protein
MLASEDHRLMVLIIKRYHTFLTANLHLFIIIAHIIRLQSLLSFKFQIHFLNLRHFCGFWLISFLTLPFLNLLLVFYFLAHSFNELSKLRRKYLPACLRFRGETWSVHIKQFSRVTPWRLSISVKRSFLASFPHLCIWSIKLNLNLNNVF